MADQGHVDFTVTYDDTGAVTTVHAPNGWTIRQVIEKAYEQLKEKPRSEDRVEFDGQSLAPYYDLHVKEFVERGIAPARHFNIVSRIGGA
jgi:hypothetical protein